MISDKFKLGQVINLINECFYDESSLNQFIFSHFSSIYNKLQNVSPLLTKITNFVQEVNIKREIFQLLLKLEEGYANIFEEYKNEILSSKQSQINYDKYKAINQLIQILEQNLLLEQLQPIYSSCRPQQANSGVTEIDQMVTQLDRGFALNSYSPLITFLAKVKEEFSSLNQFLDSWFQQYGNHFGYNNFPKIVNPSSISPSTTPCNPSEASLLLIINQKEKKIDSLELEAWLWISDKKCIQLPIKDENGQEKDRIVINIDVSEKNKNYQSISDILTELIAKSNQNLEKNQTLRLDFFLPISLLSREDFKIEFIDFYDEQGTSMKVGEMYPVVFRLTNILALQYQVSLNTRWTEHWNQLKEKSLNDLIPSSLFEESNYTFYPNESYTICLSYKKMSEVDCRDALDYVLKRLIPIFIWVRNSFTDEMCIKKIKSIFDDFKTRDIPGIIQQLPSEILEQRIQALDDEKFNKTKKHIGHHICLLWNAPERMPSNPQKPENALTPI